MGRGKVKLVIEILFIYNQKGASIVSNPLIGFHSSYIVAHSSFNKNSFIGYTR